MKSLSVAAVLGLAYSSGAFADRTYVALNLSHFMETSTNQSIIVYSMTVTNNCAYTIW